MENNSNNLRAIVLICFIAALLLAVIAPRIAGQIFGVIAFICMIIAPSAFSTKSQSEFPTWSRIARSITQRVNNRSYTFGTDAEQRRAALDEAKIFLAPYKDIWRDLRLSNKYISLILEHDGVTIRCVEKVKPYRKLQITQSHIHSPQELWNMFCIFFSYNKSYDGVLEDCHKFHASTIESSKIESSQNSTPYLENKVNLPFKQPDKTVYQKLDINNCSEIELTELPGISIVISKKIIKHREEIGGFKSIDDFFSFIKLKPHMETQLRKRVKVEKMKGSLSSKKHSERSVDF